MLILAVTWKAHAGREAEVAEIFRTLVAESLKEPGCLMYAVHRHKEDARRFFVYEQYKDEAALEAHRNSAHFQEYVKRRLAPLGERVEGNLYLPL